MIPIRNRQECYGCHDPSHKINGILILDYNAEELRAETTRDLRWLVASTAGITLLLVGAIGTVIRFAVLRRLQRFRRRPGPARSRRRLRYALLAGARV